MADQNPGDGTISADDDISMFLDSEDQTEDPAPEDEDAADLDDETTEADDTEGAEDPEDDADEADSEDDDDPVVDIETDKGTQSVHLSELRNGYLRQQDYTRKTQEIAQQRTALEEQTGEIQSQREQLKAALTQWAINRSEPDWEQMARTMDPRQFQLAQVQYQKHQEKVREAEQAYQGLLFEEAEAEKDKLLDVVPDWKDPEKARQDLGEVLQFANNYGFSQEELGSVRDHRIFLLLRDAAALHRIRQSNAKTQKRVAKTAQSLPPGARSTKSEKSARLRKQATDRFKNNPSDPDAFVDWMITG